MQEPGKTYVCIDLKSFYASVECVDRGLDPFTTNLVVADPDRTDTTICLAITPAMKEQGVKNRCRVFEIPKSMRYIMARPRMRRYMEVSANIYSVYLRYVSPEDVHVYSVDECFIDATPYLSLYEMDARSFTKMLMDAVFDETGICATAGVGTNLFLAKVALDVTAKHVDDHIGFLDEGLFMRNVWFHRPITDIWSVGPGIARRLAKYGVHDLAGVAGMRPETLYREFGVNAEYLIDHAWGQEPCTIEQIHGYEPEGHSICNSQVLPCDYSFEEARIVLREMVDASVLKLVSSGLVTGSVGLALGYASERPTLQSADVFEGGHGTRVVDPRKRHERTSTTHKLSRKTNSFKFLMEQFETMYERIADRTKPIRKVSVTFADLDDEGHATFTLFDDLESEEREHKLQEAVVAVRDKFGKNAMLKGTSLKDKATARERNQQVGGHRA